PSDLLTRRARNGSVHPRLCVLLPAPARPTTSRSRSLVIESSGTTEPCRDTPGALSARRYCSIAKGREPSEPANVEMVVGARCGAVSDRPRPIRESHPKSQDNIMTAQPDIVPQ